MINSITRLACFTFVEFLMALLLVLTIVFLAPLTECYTNLNLGIGNLLGYEQNDWKKIGYMLT